MSAESSAAAGIDVRAESLTGQMLRATITQLTPVSGARAVRKCLVSRILCLLMAIVLPTSLFAADSDRAMLYSGGTVSLNGSASPASSVIFSGDLIQTTAGSVAKINALGSSLIVLADSRVQFESNAIILEHGGVAVSTSKGMAAHAGDLTVTPVASVWTQFDVTDLDGKVQIAARKGDLTLDDGNGTTTLAQGQQTTIDESQKQTTADESDKKKKKRKSGGAVPASSGQFLDSKVALIAGGAAIVGVTTWVLIQGGSPKTPVSPSKP